MAVEPISGAANYAVYGYENVAYGTQAAAITAAFGHQLKMSTISRKNNMETLWGLGNAEATKIVNKHYEGAVTADFVMGNGYFLRMLTGATRTTTGAGPYAHYFLDTLDENLGGAVTLSNTVKSISIENGANLDADVRTYLLGCACNSATISASVNELVKVSLEMPYATETKDATYGTPIYDTWADPMSFQYGALELPIGSTIARVQSVELTITRNVELVRGLGSRFATKAPAKNAEYSAKVNLTFESKDMLESFYGAAAAPAATVAEMATLRLKFDNGGATTASRILDLKFAGVQIDEHSLPQDVTEITKQDLTLPIRAWTLAKYVDNTAGGAVPGGA